MLVNIFGGIVRCDLIAEGIINAVREVGIAVPVVIRLEGTNAEQGLEAARRERPGWRRRRPDRGRRKVVAAA